MNCRICKNHGIYYVSPRKDFNSLIEVKCEFCKIQSLGKRTVLTIEQAKRKINETLVDITQLNSYFSNRMLNYFIFFQDVLAF